jgi:hypothetical protein
MSSEGGNVPRHEAYANAVKAFYEARIEEERVEAAIRERALEAGASSTSTTPVPEKQQQQGLAHPTSSASARFVAMEAAELLDGSEFTRALDEAYGFLFYAQIIGLLLNLTKLQKGKQEGR